MMFAKLFGVGLNRQLLVVRDSTDEGYKIDFITEIDGIRVTITSGYTKKKECDKYFNQLDQTKADKVFHAILKQLS